MSEQTATEQIIARDMARLRKESEARRVLDRLRQTIQMHAVYPGRIEEVEHVRADFTMDSMAIITPLIEAVDILWAIIDASDGCIGHRGCAHSMEPWQRARDLLYRNAQSDGIDCMDRIAMLRARAAQSPADRQKRHLDEAFGK